MVVVVYNKKGGQGKTAIASNLALLKGIVAITNEAESRLLDILGEDRVIVLGPEEDFPEIDPKEAHVVIDFAGALDRRIIPALKVADAIIIPVVNEYDDVMDTLKCIASVEDYKRNIIIVANKTEKGDLEDVQDVIGSQFPDYPILEWKKSKFIQKISWLHISTHAMVDTPDLNGRHHAKPVSDQFDAIMEKIYG